MNCKPGDLAVVVRTHPDERQAAIGKIVRIVSLAPTHQAAWTVDPPVTVPWCGRRVTLQHVEDAALRPIRDPGDDARDETLEWLPVPTKETA